MPDHIFTTCCERAEQAAKNVKAMAHAAHTAFLIIFPVIRTIISPDFL